LKIKIKTKIEIISEIFETNDWSYVRHKMCNMCDSNWRQPYCRRRDRARLQRVPKYAHIIIQSGLRVALSTYALLCVVVVFLNTLTESSIEFNFDSKALLSNLLFYCFNLQFTLTTFVTANKLYLYVSSHSFGVNALRLICLYDNSHTQDENILPLYFFFHKLLILYIY